MADQTNQTQQPDAGAGQTGGATGNTPGTPNAGGQQQQQPAAQSNTQQPAQQQQPPAQPFATFPDAKSFETRMRREARKQMNEAAREAGYDDWEHMQAEIGQRQPAQQDGAKPASKPRTADTSEADRLQLALQVGAKHNLPVALVSRLQGRTLEEMEADAQALLALVRPQGQQQAPGPGIPNVPTSNQPTTFTRAQLQDAKFVREHAEEIRKAAREGRIVNS